MVLEPENEIGQLLLLERKQLGDTAVLGWGTATDYAYQVCGSDANRALYEVRFEGNKVISMNQGLLCLQGGGGGLQYMHSSNCGGNWMGLRIVGSGEVPIHTARHTRFRDR